MKKCWVIYDQFLTRVHKFVSHFNLNLKLKKTLKSIMDSPFCVTK